MSNNASGPGPAAAPDKTGSQNPRTEPALNPVLDTDAISKLLQASMGIVEVPTEPAKPIEPDAPGAPAGAEDATASDTEPVDPSQETEFDLSQIQAQTAPEAEASEGEPDAAETAEGDDAPSADPKSVQRRLHRQAEKYERQLDDLKRQVERLTREQEDAKSGENQPVFGETPADRIVNNVDDPEKLNALRSEALRARAWCRKNPQGGEYQGREMTAEQVDALHDLSDEILEVKANERAKFLDARSRHLAEVKSKYLPRLDDPSDPLTAKVRAALREFPPLRTRPDAEYLALCGIVGDYVLRQQSEAKSRPAIPAKPAPKTAGKPVAAPRKPAPGDEMANARERLKSGDAFTYALTALKSSGAL